MLERRVTTKESAGAFIVLPFKTVEQTWEQVCVAPCRGVELDRYSTYRIAPANKISGSSQFTLPQHEGPLRLKLDAGDLAAHRSGQALVGLGTAATIVGVVLLATASTFHHEDDARLAGWITTGGGVAALAVGIPLSLLTRTKVIADDGRTLGSAPGAIRF